MTALKLQYLALVLVATGGLAISAAFAEDMAESKNMYSGAMMSMHDAMGAAPVTGDADVDFVQGMIPHHQGAIDMAKIVLEKGKDPAIHDLAVGIVTAQEKEIAMMKDWLKTHGDGAPVVPAPEGRGEHGK